MHGFIIRNSGESARRNCSHGFPILHSACSHVVTVRMGSSSSILEDRSDGTMHMASQSLIPECRCDRPFSKPQIQLARFLPCLYSHTRTQDSIAIPAQGAGGSSEGEARHTHKCVAEHGQRPILLTTQSQRTKNETSRAEESLTSISVCL